MSIKDWKKLDYSDEQVKELERLSRIGDDMGDIDAHVADKILQETMKKYEAEKENNIMNKNLGNNFTEQLTNVCDKFSEWVTESQVILNSLKNVKEAVNALRELDEAPVEMLKVADDTTTIQGVKCKYAYVETEDNNFHFHDVKIESCDDYLTIYDKNGLLKFRSQIDEIVNFMREE